MRTLDIRKPSALSFQHVQELQPSTDNDAERKYWRDAKARGKTRFIWRGAIGSILIWLIVLPAGEAFRNRGHLFSLQFVIIWLIMLPIFLLGGYLTGRWKWKDLDKKYPE